MLFLQNVTFPPSKKLAISLSHFSCLIKCIWLVAMLFHAFFSSHQVSYNFLLCSPIPIGPYGPKTLVVHLHSFQKLVSLARSAWNGNYAISCTFSLHIHFIEPYYPILCTKNPMASKTQIAPLHHLHKSGSKYIRTNLQGANVGTQV
jgi:hypothetical protein